MCPPDDAPVLPPSEQKSLPPSASPPPPAVPSPAPKQTRTERIRVTTASGGLNALPAGFDDAGGDWETVTSTSLFERLYLDAAQYTAITPALVKRNHAVLEKFWTEKLATMRTGAAGSQIVRKFGGPHGSAALVESYPQKLRAAAERLSTTNGIAAHYEELQEQRRATARAATEPFLDFILSNESLEPAETERFLARAVEAGFELGEAAQVLYDTITTREFEPVSEPAGDTLADQLRSVQWLSRQRRTTVQLSVTEIVQPPAVIVPKRDPSPQFLLWGVLVTVIGTLVGLGLFFTVQRSEEVIAAPAPPPGPSTQTTVTTAAAPPSPPITMRVELPQPAEPPREDALTKAMDLLEKERAEAEARRRDAEQQEAGRREAEERSRQEAESARIHAALGEIESAVTAARGELADGEYASARNRLDNARVIADRDADRFGEELAEINRLRFEAEAGVQRVVGLQTRIAEIDALNDERKFTAAMSVANRLLKEPGIPADVAAQAERAIARAQEELQKGQKDVELKNVRTRRTKGRSR